MSRSKGRTSRSTIGTRGFVVAIDPMGGIWGGPRQLSSFLEVVCNLRNSSKVGLTSNVSETKSRHLIVDRSALTRSERINPSVQC